MDNEDVKKQVILLQKTLSDTILENYMLNIELCKKKEYIVYLEDKIKNNKDIVEEKEDLNHPKYYPPLCFNRIKDYYDWAEECEEYERTQHK